MTSYLYNLGLTYYQTAELHSQRIALSYPDGRKISFSQLNEISNQIARLLMSLNANRSDVVAIFNDKSVNAYCIMLACLKTGIIYTNLDGTNPWERISKILATCQPSLVFVDDTMKEVAEKISVETINYRSEDFANRISSFDSSNLSETRRVTGSDAAYIMFTSGSTGFPKGAVMSHDNVLNFIRWAQHTFSIVADDVFTNVNPIYFDNSVFDFYASIFSGATLVPVDAEIAKNPSRLVEVINRTRCSIWFSVPSLLVYLLTTKALSKNDFLSVRRIAFGGEGFPKNKLKQLFELLGDRISLYNVYGPTECTCICSSYLISESDFENMQELAPLGKMAPNFDYQILPNDPSQPTKGELALIGPCVGLGYFNDPARTATAFIQNNSVGFQQRMYKTGDLVELMPNGNIHFRGRADNQIKHMGYRVELEEIEAAFSTLPYVNEVGVIYEKLSAELGQIVAFVSLSAGDAERATTDIRKLVPTYMVPRKVVVLPSLPKNKNGKIDRNQLKQLK